jgi:hypothetical protein
MGNPDEHVGARRGEGVLSSARATAPRGPRKTVADFPPNNDPDLDEDGQPKLPDPERTKQSRGIGTDD